MTNQNEKHTSSLSPELVIGHTLLWGGFLMASYCSVMRLEQEDKWSTIPWFWYIVATIAGFIGVGFIRHSKSLDASDESKTEAEYSRVRQSLGDVSSRIQGLSDNSQRTPSEVVHFIDTQCVDPLAEFADSRQAMAKRFGMKVYADVMTEFASAERMVNRSWSAAADGYVDEVDRCLKIACEHFARADELLTAAEQHSSAA